MSANVPTVADRWGRTLRVSNAPSLMRAAYRSWFRVEWEGAEHLPRSGGALLVANHAGMFPMDGGIIHIGVEEMTGRMVYGLAHHGFWRIPFVGQYLSSTGAVVGHPDNAQRLLRDDGCLVLVFPEGAKGPVKPRSERYRLQRFGRGGFVETAMRAGVPIVPIALMGTEDTTPTLAVLRMLGQEYPVTLNALLFGPILGAFAQFPAKIRARVLEPTHFDGPAELEHYPPGLVMDHAEEIRARLQTAIDEMLNERQSIWRG